MFWYLLISFCFRSQPSESHSRYGHDVWQMEDGLPQSYVNSIIQSRSGYLWLGTQGGVVRFDGVRFSPTKNGDALLLKASVVLVLLEDRQGNLWVGTDGKGLFRIKNTNVVHFGEKEGFPFSSIWALCEDNSGNIWIGTDRGGLVRYHGDKFVAFTKKDGLLSNSIFAIYEDRDGSLWIGTDNGLNIMNTAYFRRSLARMDSSEILPILCFGTKKARYGSGQTAV